MASFYAKMLAVPGNDAYGRSRSDLNLTTLTILNDREPCSRHDRSGRITLIVTATPEPTSWREAIEVARVLESVVISLDRISSRMAGGDVDAYTLNQFMTEWLVGLRLSNDGT